LTSGLRGAHGHAGSVTGTSLDAKLRARIGVAALSLPRSITDAGLAAVRQEAATEIPGRARAMISAIGLRTQIDLAVRTRKPGLAAAGCGTAVAIRAGLIATPGALLRALGGLNGTRRSLSAGVAIKASEAEFVAAIDRGFVGRLDSRADTGAVIEPGLSSYVAVQQIAGPDVLAIVLAGHKTIVSTLSSGNTQEQFVTGPAVADHRITKLNHPVNRKVSTRQRDSIRMVSTRNHGDRIALLR